MGISFYEVDANYVKYMNRFAPHLFFDSKQHGGRARKYIGIVLTVNGMEYFAPLSSFKEKHRKMKERVDFLKVGKYAVINLNNMFPVPNGLYKYVDFNKEKDLSYRALLRSEYRIIKKKQDLIAKNAQVVYSHRINNGSKTALGKRCNDFLLLEIECRKYEN